MEKYFQVALLLPVSGLVAYAILGYARDCIESGKVSAKDCDYSRDSQPVMFWMTTISFFLAGTLIPLFILAMAFGILAI